MNEEQTETEQSPFEIPQAAQIDRRDDAQFQHEIKRLIQKAEEIRVGYMKKHQTYKMIGTSVGILVLLVGASGFGWFLLMSPNLVKAFACLLIAVLVPFLLNSWVDTPVKNYLKDYKTEYLPHLAELIGGFSYHPARGISEKIIRRTGIVPPYTHYMAEDCFRGHYKGTKVLFSEARLTDDKKHPVFRGIFVLLEIPHAIFEGHTIITADRDTAEKYAENRWRKLTPFKVEVSNRLWDRFVFYADKPEDSKLFVGERLIKELAETDAAFGDANISISLFKGKYIFMMVPYLKDMFEAYDLYLPISTQRHGIEVKKEIEQLLEIVDVFDLYTNKQA